MSVSFFMKKQGDMTPNNITNVGNINNPNISAFGVKTGIGIGYNPEKSDFSTSMALYAQRNYNYETGLNSYKLNPNLQLEIDGYYKPQKLSKQEYSLKINTVFQERVRFNIGDTAENSSIVSRTHLTEEVSLPVSDKFSVTGYCSGYVENKISLNNNKSTTSLGYEVGVSTKYSIDNIQSIQIGADIRNNCPEASVKYTVKM